MNMPPRWGFSSFGVGGYNDVASSGAKERQLGCRCDSRLNSTAAGAIASVAQDGEEIANFFVDLLRTRNRVGDLVTQDLAVAQAQAVHGRFDRGFSHAQLRGDFCIGQVAMFGRLEILQLFE